MGTTRLSVFEASLIMSNNQLKSIFQTANFMKIL